MWLRVFVGDCFCAFASKRWVCDCYVLFCVASSVSLTSLSAFWMLEFVRGTFMNWVFLSWLFSSCTLRHSCFNAVFFTVYSPVSCFVTSSLSK